jgi:hypothetical protein
VVQKLRRVDEHCLHSLGHVNRTYGFHFQRYPHEPFRYPFACTVFVQSTLPLLGSCSIPRPIEVGPSRPFLSVYCVKWRASPERMWARRTHLSKVGEVVNGTSVQDISPQRLREDGGRKGNGEFLFDKQTQIVSSRQHEIRLRPSELALAHLRAGKGRVGGGERGDGEVADRFGQQRV